MTSPSRSTPFESTADSLRHQIRDRMQQSRAATLDLLATVDQAILCNQAHADFSPIGWHFGHIGFAESLWLLEHCAGQPSQFPDYKRLFAADGVPKSERVHLPDRSDLCTYLETIRTQVFDYLAIAPIQQQEWIWNFLLQHESQHCETIAIVLELQNLRHQRQEPQAMQPVAIATDMVCVAAGSFQQGNDAIVALDNERPAHLVHLPTYWIDRYPVTCWQYRAFMEADGYSNPEWWSAAGWQWLQTAGVTQPLYWSTDAAFNNHPVWGVSWYEADAYARFVGKRLPTEAEWEKAARWQPDTQQCLTFPWGDAMPDRDRCNHFHLVGHPTPVNAYPLGQSPCGCADMLGNVWEWTDSWFEGYAGFAANPYRGYSQIYFDGQHRVLRGGSWATRPWAMRGSFRNWYHPHVQQIFAGFRCATDSPN